MLTKTVAALAFALLSSSASAIVLELDLLSFDGDLKFFPSQASFGSEPNDDTVGTVNGNRYIQNALVLERGEVSNQGSVITGFPWSDPSFFYNSICTALDGINFSTGPPIIRENLCKYNLCLGSKGCIFLQSGGPFDFDPIVEDADAVPDIEVTVISGTGDFLGLFGKGVIRTISVPADNDNGESLLRLDLQLF